ncbi:efflux RND transporter periplasmic adaptor subunit [Stappia indica]|uniref:efflux RND transporter periplasmic adaptor subunit n=1 Tax=Stappia indica TaxID=538381 RepID=UPI00082EE4C1|nr:efflux RND transporter periplasmic adaptor subunit [Stappia indica]
MRALAVILLAWSIGTASHAQDAPEAAPRPSLSVATTEVSTGEVTRWLYAEGVAQAARKEFLHFRQAGRVIQIAQDDEGRELRAGSHVEVGALLARIDPRDAQTALDRAEAEAQAARERVRAAQASLDQTRADFERQQSLTERNVGTRAQLDAAEGAYRTAEAGLLEAQANLIVAQAEVTAARTGLERTELTAPFSGTIALMNLRTGDDVSGAPSDLTDAAQERSAAIVLIDDAQFDVTLHLPPFEAEGLTEGKPALIGDNGTILARHIRGTHNDDPVLEGHVWSVSPSITLQRRDVTVVVRTLNSSGFLRDGGFVTVWIAADRSEDTLRIPYDAIIQRGENYFTYVVEGETAVQRPLTLGLAGLDHVEILDGMKAGEQAVIRGQHRLSDGAPVRVVEVE